MRRVLFLLIVLNVILNANDLQRIKSSGELRHLGIPYANFVTGFGNGLDVELIKGFAKYLGVKYTFVQTNWDDAFTDLTGNKIKKNGDNIEIVGKEIIKGDLIANGLTILPWRKKVLNYSTPTFPSGVWLVAKSNSDIKPIIPSNSLENDIVKVKNSIKDKKLLTRPNTCLDASLYNINKNNTKILIHPKEKSIIEMVPALINNQAEVTLLDVPDALIAIEKWSGEIKIIGPVSQNQEMGVGFRKESKELLLEFNKYFQMIKKDGTYNKMVRKYYPAVFDYYQDFFNK